MLRCKIFILYKLNFKTLYNSNNNKGMVKEFMNMQRKHKITGSRN